MRASPRRWAARTSPAAVAALLAVAAVAPVHSAPPPPGGGDPYNPGIVYRTVYSRPASDTSVAFSVACAEGMRPFGGGAQIIGATSEVLLQRAEPVHNASESGFFVAAVERAGGYSGTWQLRAVVACGPAYPDLTYMRSHTVTDSSPSRATVSTCPVGLTRVGMGAAISTASRMVHFNLVGFGSFSNAFGDFPWLPNAVRAIASELPPGTTANWSVTATVVCATPPPSVNFHSEQHNGGGPGFVDGERCGGWHPDNHSYVTGVGGGYNGDPAVVNLAWYIDDDREVGVVEFALDGDPGPATGPYVGMICAAKV